MEWRPIQTSADVPSDRSVRLAVIDGRGVAHVLVFPCRRSGQSYINATTKRPVEVYPTHWQEWRDQTEQAP